ncbi:MAG: hypothetical protein P8P67_00720 [Flavobacteriales bacterium]|jgi:hypothetical protein|nr:hypothetical protein [Flavobacteriales bacterium]
MKKITYLILLLFFVSCKKESADTIPAYIQIDDIELEEENITSNITDAWVYVNDQLQGVYKLPAKFPVLEEGVQKVRIKAGIKANGIASSRIAYPFYDSYFEDISFNPNKSKNITPTVEFNRENEDIFIEDFEGIGINLESDSLSFSTQNFEGNNFGTITLSDTMYISEVTTDEFFDLPQAGAPVFLELDYKSNTPFLVGVYVNYPQSVVQKDLLWITPKADWNKIYVNLTSTISEGINASSFKVFIGMKREGDDTNELYFDNLKVVY